MMCTFIVVICSNSFTIDPTDASADEKEIIDLTARLIAVIGAKDVKEYL